VLAKLDSTARGGMVFAIARELELPVRFIGTGEKMEDLAPFDADLFVEGLIG
jgi:fused signal recognition particle receptor